MCQKEKEYFFDDDDSYKIKDKGWQHFYIIQGHSFIKPKKICKNLCQKPLKKNQKQL